MRLFQLASKTSLVAGDVGESEEAIFKVTRQKGTVLQVLDRLLLGVQQPLYSFDDFIAMGQEQLEKFDMRVKRHRTKFTPMVRGRALRYARFPALPRSP